MDINMHVALILYVNETNEDLLLYVRYSALLLFIVLIFLCHCAPVADMDALLSLQNGLIGKLKEECHTLCSKMEKLNQSNRRVVLNFLKAKCADLIHTFLPQACLYCQRPIKRIGLC